MRFSIFGSSHTSLQDINSDNRQDLKTEVLKRRPDATPLLDVIVPVYNCAETLSDTLKSILSAGGSLNLEVIVVIDGGTDDSADIAVQILAESHVNWIVLTRPNGGLSAARNTGRELATAPYIAYLDGDDLMAPRAYEYMADYAVRYECDQVFARSAVFSNISLAVRPFYDSDVWEHILGGMEHRHFSPLMEPCVFRTEPKICARIWRRDYIEENDLTFPEGRLFEDIGVHARALASGGRIGIINKMGLIYREARSGAITQTKSAGRLDVLRNVSDALDCPVVQNLDPECGRNLLASVMRIVNWCRKSVALKFRPEFCDAQVKMQAKVPWEWMNRLALFDLETANLVIKGFLGRGEAGLVFRNLGMMWRVARPLNPRRKQYELPWVSHCDTSRGGFDIQENRIPNSPLWRWGIGWATARRNGVAIFVVHEDIDGILDFARQRPEVRVIAICRKAKSKNALCGRMDVLGVANILVVGDVQAVADQLGQHEQIDLLRLQSLTDVGFLDTLVPAINKTGSRVHFVSGNFDQALVDSLALHRRLQTLSDNFYLFGSGGVDVSGVSQAVGKPEVSVVVPVYNVEEYLDQCIQSLSDQTLLNREIILVNDGSTDNSGRICDNWVKRDSTVRVIHKENGGCASSRMRGLDEAKGEYVTFVDSDDWMEPSALEDLFYLTVASHSDVVEGDWRFVYPGPRFQHELPLESLSRWAGPGGIDYRFSTQAILGRPTIWRRLYRKAYLQTNRIKFEADARRFDDLPFQFHTLSEVETIPYVPNVILNYRQEREGQDVAIRDDRLFVHFPLIASVRDIAFNSARSSNLTSYLRVQLNTHLWGLQIIAPEFQKSYRKWAAFDLFGPHQPRSSLRLFYWCRRKRKDSKREITRLYWIYLTGNAEKSLPGYNDVR